MTKKKLRALWLDRCALQLPYCYRLCVTEKDFHKELKRLKVARNVWPPFLTTTHANASCHFFEDGDVGFCAIICLPKAAKKTQTKDAIYGLLVHEAMHLWRACKENIGERNPSEELEAYAMQRISQNLIWSWMEQTK